MIGTRCRIAFLQYIPKKPTRFGIKVWVLAEAKTGYVLDFDIYTGAAADPVKKGLGYRVVMKLIEQYQGKGHCVFVDNYYTSPPVTTGFACLWYILYWHSQNKEKGFSCAADSK